MITPENLTWLASGASSLLAVVVLWQSRRLRTVHRRLADQAARHDAVEGDIRVLTMSASGMDRRLRDAEVRWRDIQSRVQKLEGRLSSERAYREAIDLVRKGGDAERLIEELQLTEGEAQLISMLHGCAVNADD